MKKKIRQMKLATILAMCPFKKIGLMIYQNNRTVRYCAVASITSTKYFLFIFIIFSPQHYFYPPGSGIPRPVVEKPLNRSISVPSVVYDDRTLQKNSQYQGPYIASNQVRNKSNWENEVVLRRDIGNVTREIQSRNSMNQTRPVTKHIPAPDYDLAPRKTNHYDNRQLDKKSRF
jgi:hypothetical protein